MLMIMNNIRCILLGLICFIALHPVLAQNNRIFEQYRREKEKERNEYNKKSVKYILKKKEKSLKSTVERKMKNLQLI